MRRGAKLFFPFSSTDGHIILICWRSYFIRVLLVPVKIGTARHVSMQLEIV